MKCFKHPKEDALYDCSVCGKPICGECMRFSDEEDHIACPDCDVGSARQIGAVAAKDLKEYHKSIAGNEVLAKQNARFEIKFNPVLLIVVILIAALYLFLRFETTDAQPIVTYGDFRMMENDSPAPQFTYLLAQIFRYREEKGDWPEKLTDLMPKYIDTDPFVLKTKESFLYAADPRKGFVLTLPWAERFGYLKMEAASDGMTEIE